MLSIIVTLECLTNLHVGDGDINYNIIDNEVERDPVTNYPTINASGVKGALREFFVQNKIGYVNEIFGANNQGNSTPGRLKILGADMMAVPVRASKGNKPYYLITTDTAINLYNEKVNNFGNNAKKINKITEKDSCEGEGITLNEKVKYDEKDIYVVSEDDYRKIFLPVIARNKLDNGISQNLWYEEVVPHRSIFTFVVLALDTDGELLDEFKAAINGKVIQFGANSTIGYGLCKVTVQEVE